MATLYACITWCTLGLASSALISNPFSGKCLDVQHIEGTDDSANVVLQGCDAHSRSQKWSHVEGGALLNLKSGKCLDIKGGSGLTGIWDGTAMIIYTCNGADNQKFTHIDGVVKNPSSDKCLDLFKEGKDDGTNVVIYRCHDGQNQKFGFSDLLSVMAPSYGKCLHIDGGNVVSWHCHGGKDQLWMYVNGAFINPASGKCLDVKGQGTKDGTNVILWECNGGKNQMWQDMGGAFTNPVSGKCLDIKGESHSDGANIVLWDCHGSANQDWMLFGSQKRLDKHKREEL